MKERKLSIDRQMRALDGKVRDFPDTLTDEERREFSEYMMIRWSSSVQGSADLQAYYLMSCNENLNKHFFDLAKHPKLQWLAATTVSPGMGAVRHEWIKQKKLDNNNKVLKFLRNLRPDLGEDDIALLAEINTVADLKQMARELGWDDKRIKSEL
jgi:hypothetical protein